LTRANRELNDFEDSLSGWVKAKVKCNRARFESSKQDSLDNGKTGIRDWAHTHIALNLEARNPPPAR
jgi:hypothetical protein